MSIKLAVAVMHGIGTQTEDFAEPTISSLSDRLANLGKDPAEVAWARLYWADILRDRQEAYLRRARAANPMDWNRVRNIVVDGLGDAAAYQFVQGRPSGTYRTIHARVRDRIHQLYVGDLGSQPVPLVVLAHSLGSHILSSYIWDSQQGYDSGADPASSEFERMEWLACMVTFGSTIPLFTFAHDEVVPITLPGSRLPPTAIARPRWLNFYDQDDVLGYPLKPLSPEYDATVDADTEINAGGFGVSGTPLSHNGYWMDNDFLTPVAGLLATFL